MFGTEEASHNEVMNATQLFFCSSQTLSGIPNRYLVLSSEADL